MISYRALKLLPELGLNGEKSPFFYAIISAVISGIMVWELESVFFTCFFMESVVFFYLRRINMDYDAFCEKYQYFAKDLCVLGKEIVSELKIPEEHPFYNAGTMARAKEASFSSNIVLANAREFKRAYVNLPPEMGTDEKKARVVFGFLQQNGVSLSYEQNSNDVLFVNPDNGKDVFRADFYAGMVFGNAVENTNYISRYIGDMQIITLPEQKPGQMPKNTKGLSAEVLEKLGRISEEERQEMFLKRGLYHESMHVALGTDDERKCDVFALLKVMKEHPEHAQEVFEVYNMQRSKIGHTVEAMSVSRKDAKVAADNVKIGTMTYLMPRTYATLRQYAEQPEKIPDTDRGILKLTYEMTSNPEFSHQELGAFLAAVSKDKISRKELSETAVVQACMTQGGFKDFGAYVASDKTLDGFLKKRGDAVDVKSMVIMTGLQNGGR